MIPDASSNDKVRKLHEKLDREAKDGGYNLNPDADLVTMLCEGLVANIERYGYGACPCRLATGRRADDLDIICPCDYRDPDLADYDTCYCALYVGDDVVSGKKHIGSIPERRPTEDERKAARKAGPAAGSKERAASGVWRCKVCGYLCAMDSPPGKCPICKADKDRFEEFALASPGPVWRCKVCGYLCAMESPPGKCPVCKADRDRFESF